MLQCTSPLSASTFAPCETQLPQCRDRGLSLDTPFLVVSTMLERSRCSISICGMQTPGMWHQPGWHLKNRFSYSVSDWGLGIKQQPAIGPVEDEAGGVGSSVEGCWRRSGSIRSSLVRAAGPRPGWLWISREQLGSPGNHCLGCLPWPQSERFLTQDVSNKRQVRGPCGLEWKSPSWPADPRRLTRQLGCAVHAWPSTELQCWGRNLETLGTAVGKCTEVLWFVTAAAS